MHKYINTLIMILSFMILLPSNVKAESIMDINELIEHAKEIDGQEITVQGEVIGERMDRGNFSWININDGTNAIGIWITKKEAEMIISYGTYKCKGDTVKITGIFNRACKVHGGESDLHNKTMTIVKKGNLVNEEIPYMKIVTAILLVSFVLLSLLFSLKRSKFEKIVMND